MTNGGRESSANEPPEPDGARSREVAGSRRDKCVALVLRGTDDGG